MIKKVFLSNLNVFDIIKKSFSYFDRILIKE